MVSPPVYVTPDAVGDWRDRAALGAYLRVYDYLRSNKQFTMRAAAGLGQHRHHMGECLACLFGEVVGLDGHTVIITAAPGTDQAQCAPGSRMTRIKPRC